MESFLFRRAVVGRFSTGLNNFFAGMYRELETSADPEEYVTAMLLIHGRGMTAYFPTDGDFAEQLKSRDLYHRFSKSRYYLERLENWSSSKEPIPSGKYQIEHVMPQSIDASPEWQAMLGNNWVDVHERLCNTLGNLTLTGYNQEYSNRPFRDKLTLKPGGLRKSHLHLNDAFDDCDTWDEAAILGRADALAKEALEVWPYPNLPEQVVDAYRPKKAAKPDAGWTIEEHHPSLCPAASATSSSGPSARRLSRPIRTGSSTWRSTTSDTARVAGGSVSPSRSGRARGASPLASSGRSTTSSTPRAGRRTSVTCRTSGRAAPRGWT